MIRQTVKNTKAVQEYIKNCDSNNWKGTCFEDYPRLDPKQKGGFGELVVENIGKKNKPSQYFFFF